MANALLARIVAANRYGQQQMRDCEFDQMRWDVASTHYPAASTFAARHNRYRGTFGRKCPRGRRVKLHATPRCVHGVPGSPPRERGLRGSGAPSFSRRKHIDAPAHPGRKGVTLARPLEGTMHCILRQPASMNSRRHHSRSQRDVREIAIPRDCAGSLRNDSKDCMLRSSPRTLVTSGARDRNACSR